MSCLVLTCNILVLTYFTESLYLLGKCFIQLKFVRNSQDNKHSLLLSNDKPFPNLIYEDTKLYSSLEFGNSLRVLVPDGDFADIW